MAKVLELIACAGKQSSAGPVRLRRTGGVVTKQGGGGEGMVAYMGGQTVED